MSFRPALEVNSIEALRNASDKLRAFQLMRSQGVPVPNFWPSSSELPTFESSSTTLLARTRRGWQGQGITVWEAGRSTTPPLADLYVEYVPNRREYRVHVFQGRVIRVQGKYLDFPEQHTNPYIQNYQQGFRFRSPNVQVNQDRLDAAVAAVAALGLDFGAVDLLIGEDRQTYVLEVNTAPSCSPLTARAYVDSFAELLGVEPDYSALEELRNGGD